MEGISDWLDIDWLDVEWLEGIGDGLDAGGRESIDDWLDVD